MVSALLFILDVVAGVHPAVYLAGIALVWFVTSWYVLPVWMRICHRHCMAAEDDPASGPEPAAAG